MKTFRDLYIRLNGINSNDFLEKLENELKAPWVRRRDKEKEFHNVTSDSAICFEAQEGSNVSPSALFIFQKDNDTLWVSNIVPTGNGGLTYDQYNFALENFYENIVTPAIEDISTTAELTSDQISVGKIAGEEVEKALMLFSDSANKSTGSSHPADNRRWLEFLVLAQEAKPDLDPDIIIRTLTERGWSEDMAFKLGIQFEFAQDLLSYAGKR